jgi:hypothetical protein
MLVSGAPSSTSFLSDVISIQLLSAVIEGPRQAQPSAFLRMLFCGTRIEHARKDLEDRKRSVA